MIYDEFENIGLYCKKGEKLYKALKYAFDFDLAQPDGEYEVQGREIFAKVQTYETAPAEEKKFESHKDYYDIQVLRSGCERQDVALGQKLEPLGEYDPKKDVVKLKAPQMYSSIVMEPGKFAVFYPQDIHRPNCNLNGKCKVRKICMKVKI
jgi:YhcH/YjgK/YiaL family protein